MSLIVQEHATDKNSTPKEAQVKFCSCVEYCYLSEQHIKILGINAVQSKQCNTTHVRIYETT